MPGITDAVGIAFAAVAEEHLFSMFLSSPGTIRKLYIEKGADTSALDDDLNIALGLGIAFSFLMGWLLQSKITVWGGVAFGIIMYYIYKNRAGL